MKMDAGIKKFSKQIRWETRRLIASYRWGKQNLANAPIVLANSMPKSGSHLIIQILEALPQIGPFINPGMPPLNRDEENTILSAESIIRRANQLRAGDIGYCYLRAEEPYLTALTRKPIAPIFVYRDPRDMIVSHVFYATDMHQGHNMHRYYTTVLTTMEQRINAAILGVTEPDSPLSPITLRYDRYIPWLSMPQVLSLRFEELILDRPSAVLKILQHLAANGFEPQLPQADAVHILSTAVQPKKSGTFRKGQPGNWRDHFTPGNMRLFKEKTGDLLVRLGYETTLDW